MTAQLVAELTVFALAIFVGIEVISKVPSMLHTPLMSGTNAIHGSCSSGCWSGSADSTLEQVLAFVAVVFGTINIVGGFLVTDRCSRHLFAARKIGRMSKTWIDLAYLVAAILFIIGIKRRPRTARSGNWIAAAWAARSAVVTFASKEIDQYWLILAGIAVGRWSACSRLGRCR